MRILILFVIVIFYLLTGQFHKSDEPERVDTVIRIPVQLVQFDHQKHPDHLALSKILLWTKGGVLDHPSHWKDPRWGMLEINKEEKQVMTVIAGFNDSTGKLELIMDLDMDGSHDNDSLIVIQREDSAVTIWLPDYLGRTVLGGESASMPLKISDISQERLFYNMPVLAVGEFEWMANQYEIQIMSAYTVNTSFKKNIFLVRDKASAKAGSLMEDLLKIGDDIFSVDKVDTQEGFVELRRETSLSTPVKPQVGFHAPGIKETAIYPKGLEVNLDDYRGRYVWVNFWATWCAPCLTHMDEMKKLQEELELDLINISVNIGGHENMDHVLSVIRQRGYEWTHLMSEEVSQTYNALHLPTSFLIDPDGIIVSMDESITEYLLIYN